MSPGLCYRLLIAVLKAGDGGIGGLPLEVTVVILGREFKSEPFFSSRLSFQNRSWHERFGPPPENPHWYVSIQKGREGEREREECFCPMASTLVGRLGGGWKGGCEGALDKAQDAAKLFFKTPLVSRSQRIKESCYNEGGFWV